MEIEAAGVVPDDMSTRMAAIEGTGAPRVLLVDDGRAHDVFEVLAIDGELITARSAYLYEVGEELAVRIERDGAVSEATARVRAHVGPDDAKVTELELSDVSEPRRVVSG